MAANMQTELSNYSYEILDSENKHDQNQSNKQLTYETKREMNKNSITYSVFIMLKGMLGIGIFCMPGFFYKCGMILSTLTLIFLIFNFYFCIIMIHQVACDVEKKNPSIQLDTLDSLFIYFTNRPRINKSCYYFVKVLAKIQIFNILGVYGVYIIEFINISKFLLHLAKSSGLSEGVFTSLLFYKFLIFGVILLFLILFPLPELLRMPSMLATIVVIICAIYFVFYNFVGIELPLSSKPLWNVEIFFAFSNSYIFLLGITPMSMQVRSTIRSKTDFPKVLFFD